MVNTSKVLSPKRTQIIEAARKLFLEGGYDATSMDAIATEAGVTKRTAYNHFKNKESLFSAIMEKMCAELSQSESNESLTLTDRTPEQVLKATARKYLLDNLTPQAIDLVRVVVAESSRFPELGRIYWNTNPNNLKLYISEFLSEMDRQGVLSVPDPDLAALQFIGMFKEPYFMPLMLGFGQPPSKKELDITLDKTVSSFLAGIQPIPE